MLFNTLTFAVFFAIVYSAYWLNKRNYRRQNLILFVASYTFYGWWDFRFLFLLVISTFLDYTSSIIIDRSRLSTGEKAKAYGYLLLAAVLLVVFQRIEIGIQAPFITLIDARPDAFAGPWILPVVIGFLALFEVIQQLLQDARREVQQKFFLAWSISLNLAILCIFKYLGFFVENFVELWSWLFGYTPPAITLNIVLPVGVSFFVFQTISHTVDVYWEKIPATSSLLELSTYIAFFPQLVAGPIERGAHLLPQFQEPRKVTGEDTKEGLWLIAWGLYKKIVVADNVAEIVNRVFMPYDALSAVSAPDDGIRCLLAVYAFAVQIYCDFSGYTDVARGTARLLGFRIMLNFNLPYIALNPSDFWSRWHISLSSWLRDYLYIPLGGNRHGQWATYRNLMITMLLGGLWHGAAWNFVYWGAFHGLLLIAYDLFRQKNVNSELSFKNVIKGFIMFHLVCVGWLLFRAQNMETVYAFFNAVFRNFSGSPEAVVILKNLIFFSWFLVVVQTAQALLGRLNIMRGAPWFLRLNVWIFIVVSIIGLAPQQPQEFIYFAF